MKSTQKLAQLKLQVIERKRKSARFKKVIGRLIASRLLQPIPNHAPFRGKVALKDMLWAGTIEPRILEVLPAIIIKRPSLLEGLSDCPKDLKHIVKDIRRGKATKPFRGIPANSYLRWMSRVGHSKVTASLLKSFRFKEEDLKILEKLKTRGFSEVDAIRQGLKLLLDQTDEARSVY